MSQREKLYRKLRNNPGNINKADFLKALKRFGFTVDSKAGKGSHIQYYYKGCTKVPVRTVNVTDPIRPYHVKSLISDIEEVSK